ncbi:VCBS repeat-containing protein [Stieleria sp. JC731]|uniref:FG-GAP repeat domain-containing protein n=1 Tax=Pirellulaceae TaxID=2691357 RepID=UPI001E4B00E3|nr:VCBS repeat-containing protein [Stieleria sp. JC731]MCC9603676.1 VCBS repeat-containing protein [Stieleria sp. JC731]
MKRLSRLLLALSVAGVSSTAIVSKPVSAEDYELHRFETQQLSDTYFSEGAGAGDINGDGVVDVVYGPYWFAGPDFKQKYPIYEPVPQDKNRYADHFFAWVRDFNSDGHEDVFVVGFPGTPAYVYENPGNGLGQATHWNKHQVIDWVSNESPQLIDVVGDSKPELVCTRDGMFGFATIEWEGDFPAWTFHPISGQVTATRFGHGLGAGDINGDGRTDIIHSGGWYEQPKLEALTSRWKSHQARFSTAYGGAEMYAYDVDGDGDNDVITSEAAHDFGLSWYEQTRDGEAVTFKRHMIMGSHPSENSHGVVFSELHSVALSDIDGDGLKDIVTGKTYWSHHKQSPMWDAGAVVYWFKLDRSGDSIEWLPYQAAADPGIGRQITIADLNGDDRPDIVVGGMKGAHVLVHKTASVSESEWKLAQPKRYDGPTLPTVDSAKRLRGEKVARNGDQSNVADAIEGESLKVQVSKGSAAPQSMSGFGGDRWSGDSQLFWRGGQRGETLTISLPETQGDCSLFASLTCARDYGIVQFYVDDKPLGQPIDLYEPNVVTSGEIHLGDFQAGGKHQLKVQIVGANPDAAKAYMFGLDYLKVQAKK